MSKPIVIRLWVFVFLMPMILWSHPHMFVDCEPQLHFDSEGFVGVEHHWIFDEMYSIAIWPHYDANKDGKFTPEELARLDMDVLQPFKKYDYFTIVLVDFSPKMPVKTENFQAFMEDNRLHFRFFAPVKGKKAVSEKWSMILVAIFDPTNYSSLNMLEDKITLKNVPSLETDFFVDDASEIVPFDQRDLTTRGIFVRYKVVN